MGALKMAAPPHTRSFQTMIDRPQEIATPMIVTVWAPARPITLPNRPARMAPSKGSRGMASSRFEFIVGLPFERAQVFDIDAAPLTEQDHQDRQANRGLGRRDGEHEEHEHLAVDIAHEARKCHEV